MSKLSEIPVTFSRIELVIEQIAAGVSPEGIQHADGYRIDSKFSVDDPAMPAVYSAPPVLMEAASTSELSASLPGVINSLFSRATRGAQCHISDAYASLFA